MSNSARLSQHLTAKLDTDKGIVKNLTEIANDGLTGIGTASITVLEDAYISAVVGSNSNDLVCKISLNGVQVAARGGIGSVITWSSWVKAGSTITAYGFYPSVQAFSNSLN